MTTHVVPAVLRHRVPRRPSLPLLARRERVLLEEPGTVVLTTFALCARGESGWRRLPWEEIGRVRVTGPEVELTRFSGETVHIRPLPGSRVVDVIRDRVAATELAGVTFIVNGYRLAVVAARRRCTTGEVIWIVILPDGVDSSSPWVQAQVDGAVRDLRHQLALA